jgi:hypothetical protein
MRPHPHLLEVSAWPWLERLSRDVRRQLTLADIPGRVWDEMASLGFDILYLMGVWRRSPTGRLMARTDPSLQAEYDRALPDWRVGDVPGSPYSIEAYEPDDRMGGWRGLDAARHALHARGMRLVVDFVPNHLGFDHAWISEHPERFVLGTPSDQRDSADDFRPVERGDEVHFVARGRDPYFPAWRDVAQLNYFNPDTRVAMIGVLREIAGHADGVRCDMAMLALNEVFERTWRRVLREKWPRPEGEFWPEATRAVPDLLYLAEVYWDLEWTLQQQGFHFTYDKRLLDRLHGAPARQVREHLQAEPAYRDRLARFLENHDEPRSAATLNGRLPAAAAMLATLPGMRFFFDGQLDGARIKPPVQLGRWRDEPVDRAIRALYGRILRAADEDLFHYGEWKLLDVAPAGDRTSEDLIAYRWRLDDAWALTVANLGERPVQGHVAVAGEFSRGTSFDFEDCVSEETYRWRREDIEARGLFVRLAPGAAHVMFVRPA